jgi:hypothetical protein
MGNLDKPSVLSTGEGGFFLPHTILDNVIKVNNFVFHVEWFLSI